MKGKHAAHIFTFDIDVNLFPKYETLSLFQCKQKIDCLLVARIDTAANIDHNSLVQTHLVLVRLKTVQETHLC
jgi:hypothetical protein